MTEPKIETVMLRGLQENDIHFIFSSWLKSFRGSNFSKNISNTLYFDQQHKLIEHLLATAHVVIACNKEDPEQIFGYMVGGFVGNLFVVHYIYVKHPYRRLGVGNLLLNSMDHSKATAHCYTHDTPTASRLAAKFGLVYHPYLLFGIVNEANEESQSDEREEVK